MYVFENAEEFMCNSENEECNEKSMEAYVELSSKLSLSL